MNTLSQTLTALSESLPGLLPELALGLLLVLIVLLDLVLHGRTRKPLLVLTFIGLGSSFYLLYEQAAALPAVKGLFLNLLHLDGLAVYLKGLFVLASMLVLLIALASAKERQPTNQTEWLAPFIAVLLGAHLLVMSTNLLMLYLSVELISLSSYILTVNQRDQYASEGGIKYLLFGAMSSALMLYGISWLYGFTGTFYFTDPAFYKALSSILPIPLLMAVSLTLCGLLFKISAVPFHVWTPDVYQSAPLPVAAFFSVVPKAAGIGALIRLLSLLNLPGLTEGLCLIILLTLTVGNFAALWQQNIRRMLAYSSIAHAGFLLIGILVGGASGTQSVLFYLGIYVFMNLAAFLLAMLLSQRTGSELMASYAGVGVQMPMAGVAVVIIMVALAGLPPTAGFTAKLFLFSSLWQAFQQNGNSWLLVLFGIGLLNVAVSLFYYLKIPYYLFFRVGGELKKPHLSIYEGVLVIALVVPVIVLFVKPDWLFQVITIIVK